MGFRAFLEDADDVGILSIQTDTLVFRGDHSDFTIILSNNIDVKLCNIGWRGLWIAGHKIRITFPGHDEIKEVEIGERKSWTIGQSRRLAREIFEAIESRIR